MDSKKGRRQSFPPQESSEASEPLLGHPGPSPRDDHLHRPTLSESATKKVVTVVSVALLVLLAVTLHRPLTSPSTSSSPPAPLDDTNSRQQDDIIDVSELIANNSGTLQERCGDDCKFIMPVMIGEQETRGQMHLYQLAILAHALDRVLVLPNAQHSRFSVCFAHPFSFYYSPTALSRFGLPTVSQQEFESYIADRTDAQRGGGSSDRATAQIVEVANPVDWKGRAVGLASPFVFAPGLDDKGHRPRPAACVKDLFDWDKHHSVGFYGQGTNVEQMPDLPHFLASVYKDLKANIGAKSATDPPATVIHMSYAGQHPDFHSRELHALDSSKAVALPFAPFEYSRAIAALADVVARRLSPFVVVQWRTEQVPASRLAPCGRDLLARLARLRQESSPALKAAYVATDYPLERYRSRPGVAGDRKARPHSASYHIPDDTHDAMRDFLDNWAAAGDSVPKLTTWDDEELALLEGAGQEGDDDDKTVPSEAASLVALGRARDVDLSLLGMLDKLVGQRAEVFVAGEADVCGKYSSYLWVIWEGRKARVRADGGEFHPGQVGRLWNEAELFTLPSNEDGVVVV